MDCAKRPLARICTPELPFFDLSEVGPDRIDVRVSQEQMLGGISTTETRSRVFSVLYDGVMTVTDAAAFVKVLHSGYWTWQSLRAWAPLVAPIA